MILDAIDNSRFDDRAAAECKTGGTGELVAAFDSTAAEVRAIAVVPPGKPQADVDHLPDDDAAEVAVCVAHGDPGDGRDVYIAMWRADRASGIVVIFDDDGITQLR